MTKAGKWRNSFITNLARLAGLVAKTVGVTILAVIAMVAVIVLVVNIGKLVGWLLDWCGKLGLL